MRTIGIILAAGGGTRMGGSVKKQYRELKGHPVLLYSIWAFEKSNIDDIIVVCGQGEKEQVENEILKPYNFAKMRAIVEGANERSGSSLKGIKAAKELCHDATHVLIHDAARPLVTSDLIDKVIKGLDGTDHKVVLPAISPNDTVRLCAGGDDIITISRESVRLMQTPQGFDIDLIMHAYENLTASVTDDAEAVLLYNELTPISLVEGESSNIKLTYPVDFTVAGALLDARENE